MTASTPQTATRWLIRFGYDGKKFAGWARQPGLRTVEEEIRRGLVRIGIVPNVERARLEVASRTDRGVSARANALALSCRLPGETLLRALNGIAPDIFFTRATPVSPSFRPRAAVQRWYRFFEPAQGRQLSVWQAAAPIFARTIDVRSFGRGLPVGTPIRRRIDQLSVRRSGAWFVVDIRAPAFVWGMVRKIVSALREVDHGRLTLRDLSRAVQGRSRLTLPLAEAEFLVLWDVIYDRGWKYRSRHAMVHQRRHMRTEIFYAEARALFLPTLWPLLLREATGYRGSKIPPVARRKKGGLDSSCKGHHGPSASRVVPLEAGIARERFVRRGGDERESLPYGIREARALLGCSRR